MNTKRTDSKSIWKVAGMSLVAMTILIAGSAAASELQNGFSVPVSGTAGAELHFFLPVPVGATSLEIVLIEATGQAKLYTRFGAAPTRVLYDCGDLPASIPTTDICSSESPNPGTWYVMIYGLGAFVDARLDAQYVCDGGCEDPGQLRNGVAVTGLSASYRGDVRFSLEVPTGASNLNFSLSGGTGDADLYVKRGTKPTVTEYDHRSMGTTNDENCGEASPAAGTWHVMVHAYQTFSGVTLTASYDSPFGCTPSPTNLCLNQNRFRVEVNWRDFHGNTGSGQMVPVESADSGLFWFFDQNNWEMLVKILNACGLNNHFWVFAAATTNVEYTLRVTDTETNVVKTYFNRLGNPAPALTDTSAFATCP